MTNPLRNQRTATQHFPGENSFSKKFLCSALKHAALFEVLKSRKLKWDIVWPLPLF